MAHPIETCMAALATHLRAEADLPAFADNVWDVPPDNLPRLPAIVILWDSETASEFDGQGDVPMGRQYLDEQLEIRILSNQPDAPRAQAQLLPAVDAVRRVCNTHKLLRNGAGTATCLTSRYEGAKVDPVDYGDVTSIAGATITFRVYLDVAGNFAG